MRYQAETIIADVLRQCSHAGYTSYPEAASRLQGAVRDLCGKLNALQGYTKERPDTFWSTLGDVPVLISFDKDDTQAWPTDAYVNGDWCDMLKFDKDVIQQWEHDLQRHLLEEKDESARANWAIWKDAA